MNLDEICNLLENVVNAHDPRDTAFEIMCQIKRSADHGFEEENKIVGFGGQKVADHA